MKWSCWKVTSLSSLKVHLYRKTRRKKSAIGYRVRYYLYSQFSEQELLLLKLLIGKTEPLPQHGEVGFKNRTKQNKAVKHHATNCVDILCTLVCITKTKKQKNIRNVVTLLLLQIAESLLAFGNRAQRMLAPRFLKGPSQKSTIAYLSAACCLRFRREGISSGSNGAVGSDASQSTSFLSGS